MKPAKLDPKSSIAAFLQNWEASRASPASTLIYGNDTLLSIKDGNDIFRTASTLIYGNDILLSVPDGMTL